MSLQRAQFPTAFGEVTCDRPLGTFWLYQRKKGYRYSTDDVVTASEAMRVARDATRPVKHFLDLGSGIGCVGIPLATQLPDLQFTGVEVQDTSVALFVENVKMNNIASQTQLIHSDLRSLGHHPLGKFDLISATPPYFNLNQGKVPPDEQKAACRFELAGTVADYASVAKAHLNENGTFVCCFPFQQRKRALAAFAQADFTVARELQVMPRRDSHILFSVFSLRVDAPASEPETLVVRELSGEFSVQMRLVHSSLGAGVLK
jgi:tRNA1Val (adenine37-N6)-methyltransferase